MRIELDKPLTKTKLKQALKIMGDAKRIKVIMGTEIFDIDTIVSKGDTIYFCTDSKETADFYEKKVEEKPNKYGNIVWTSPYRVYTNFDWNREWEKYRKKHRLNKYHVGDTPGFGDDITCQNQE